MENATKIQLMWTELHQKANINCGWSIRCKFSSSSQGCWTTSLGKEKTTSLFGCISSEIWKLWRRTTDWRKYWTNSLRLAKKNTDTLTMYTHGEKSFKTFPVMFWRLLAHRFVFFDDLCFSNKRRTAVVRLWRLSDSDAY